MGICRSSTHTGSSRVYTDPVPLNKDKNPQTEYQTEKLPSPENGDISKIKNMPVTNQMDPQFPSPSLNDPEPPSKVLPTHPKKTKNSNPRETKPVETKNVEVPVLISSRLNSEPIGVVLPNYQEQTKEVKPVEVKPVEVKPVEVKPVEAKPVEAKLVEVKPVEVKPVEAKLVEAKPVVAKLVEAKPVEVPAPIQSPKNPEPIGNVSPTHPDQTLTPDLTETKPVEPKNVEVPVSKGTPNIDPLISISNHEQVDALDDENAFTIRYMEDKYLDVIAQVSDRYPNLT